MTQDRCDMEQSQFDCSRKKWARTASRLLQNHPFARHDWRIELFNNRAPVPSMIAVARLVQCKRCSKGDRCDSRMASVGTMLFAIAESTGDAVVIAE